MADIFLANTVKDKIIKNRIYDAVVVSREDSLGKGRISVKVPELLAENETIWVQPLLSSGGLTIIAIPPEGQEVKIYFNGTIDEGYWFGGNIKKDSITDPDTVLIADDKNNTITWQRKTGDFKINSIGPIELISETNVKLKAPTIELDGEIKCSNGASGIITLLNCAVVKSGIVTQVS